MHTMFQVSPCSGEAGNAAKNEDQRGGIKKKGDNAGYVYIFTHQFAKISQCSEHSSLQAETQEGLPVYLWSYFLGLYDRYNVKKSSQCCIPIKQ